jgi:hypothetical protein
MLLNGRASKLSFVAAGVVCCLQLLSIPHAVEGSPFPALSTRHVIREIRWNSKEKKSRSSGLSSSLSQNSSLVNDDPKNHNLLRTSSKHRNLAQGLFSQCSADEGQEGVFDDPLIGCVDVLQEGVGLVDDLFDVLNAAIADTGTSTEVSKITEDVLEPINTILKKALEIGLDTAGFAFNFCLGDFTGEEIVNPEDPDDEINLCSDLPLNNDADWSLIAAQIGIPAIASASVCPLITDGVDIGVCIAISKCDGVPTVAFSVSGGFLACLAGKFTFMYD